MNSQDIPLRTSRGLVRRVVWLSWAAMCLALYMYSPGTISHIHQFVPDTWDTILTGAARIEPARFLLDTLKAFGGVLVFSLAITSLGLGLLRLLRVQPPPERLAPLYIGGILASGFLAGQAFSSSVFLLLAHFGKLTPVTVSVLLVISLLNARGLVRYAAALAQHVRARSEASSWFDRTLLVLGLAVLFCSLFYSSTRLSYDSVSMYFANAKLIAMTGQLEYFRSGSFLVSSLHLGTQYAAIIQVFGDQAARMYSWIAGVVLVIFMLAIEDDLRLPRRARLISLVLFATSTAFLDLMGDGKIDLMTSAYSLGAVYWLVRRGPNALLSRSVDVLIGLLASFSVVSRPFNLLLMGAFIGLFVIWEHRVGRRRISLARLLMLGLGAALPTFFHLLASWLATGTPFDTLLTAQSIGVSDWQWSFDPRTIWVFRLLYPLVATFVNSPQTLGNISPLFVMLLPAFLIPDALEKVQLSREVRTITAIAVVTLFIWLMASFAVVEIRYVFFLWILLFYPVSILADQLMSASTSFLGPALKGFIVVLTAFILVRTLVLSVAAYSPVDAGGAPQCFDSPLCEFLRPLNAAAPPGSRVLVLSAYRYYLRPDLFVNSSKAEDYAKMEAYFRGPAEQFWEQVYCQRYTYIAYETNYAVRHLNMDFKGLLNDSPPWMRLETLSQSKDNKQRAYAISWESVPGSVQQACTGQ